MDIRDTIFIICLIYMIVQGYRMLKHGQDYIMEERPLQFIIFVFAGAILLNAIGCPDQDWGPF